MNPVQLDTTQAATDTVQYVVTDQSGLTATSTQATSSPANIQNAPQAANDNQASTTPPAANDNTPPLDATGTAATSTAQ
jgi:hypothetical protein